MIKLYDKNIYMMSEKFLAKFSNEQSLNSVLQSDDFSWKLEQDKHKLYKMIDQLKPKEKEVLTWIYFHNRNVRQTTEILNCCINYVKYNCLRAINKIRENWSNGIIVKKKRIFSQEHRDKLKKAQKLAWITKHNEDSLWKNN